ncbi:MAG: adenylyltransferase/cytidyltransferase family protein, partial [Candidatus Njordarchaeota archaeon]
METEKNKTKILVGGTFDIIHIGHIRFLNAAKKLAENAKLIVIIARDKNVKRIKGREPIFDEKERMEIVKSLKPVDEVVLGNEQGSLFDIIEKIKPDIIALGYDQKISEDDLRLWMERKNIKFKVVRLPKFNS